MSQRQFVLGITQSETVTLRISQILMLLYLILITNLKILLILLNSFFILKICHLHYNQSPILLRKWVLLITVPPLKISLLYLRLKESHVFKKMMNGGLPTTAILCQFTCSMNGNSSDQFKV